MLSRKQNSEKRRPFDAPDVFDGLAPSAATQLAMAGGEVILVLDATGMILDASANLRQFPDIEGWIGREWFDTVTVESQPKLMEMLAAARKGQVQHWRQVNHPAGDGDIPVRYVVVNANGGDSFIAIGRDMRDASALQQRLLQAQQTLERDYLNLRQNQARYRLLFEKTNEAVLIVERDNFRIREANRAAHSLLGQKSGSLPGTKLPAHFANGDRDALIAALGSALTSENPSSIALQPRKGKAQIAISATGFRQQGAQWLLLRLAPAGEATNEFDKATMDVIEAMPDAFVLTDADMRIITANLAFVDLVQAASPDQVRGKTLGEFFGRPGIDLDLIRQQLGKNGIASNVLTMVGPENGEGGEPVELSAVQTSGDEEHFGFVLRAVGRRLRDLPPSQQDLPRSVEQLTELVGRMSLKDIVRESTDLIERLCIEAALSYTSDNRASAAEILGLSRQSLYSKLHRYGFAAASAEAD